MADDAVTPSPSVIANDFDDDFYSLRNATDDGYWKFKDNFNDDDEANPNYFSSKGTTSWLDALLSNTTGANEGQLTPVEDVNPDNVLATLIFNSIVCVILLALYELLRRWIPSVYSQRVMAHRRNT